MYANSSSTDTNTGTSILSYISRLFKTRKSSIDSPTKKKFWHQTHVSLPYKDQWGLGKLYYNHQQELDYIKYTNAGRHGL